MKTIRGFLAMISLALLLGLTTHPAVFDVREARVIFALGDPVQLEGYTYRSPGSQGRRISTLSENEEVILVHRMAGCWSHFSRVLTLAPDENRNITVRIDSGDQQEEGDVILTNDELVGLDKLLDRYRSTPAGWATTQELIQFRWMHQNKMVGFETFVTHPTGESSIISKIAARVEGAS